MTDLLGNFGFAVTVLGAFIVPGTLIWYVFKYEYKPLSDNEFEHQMSVNAKRTGKKIAKKEARLSKRARV